VDLWTLTVVVTSSLDARGFLFVEFFILVALPPLKNIICDGFQIMMKKMCDPLVMNACGGEPVNRNILTLLERQIKY
jgi:hypothetical protein